MSDGFGKTPRWKQAVDDMIEEFKYGDLVPHSWMEQRFGMPSLGESRRMTEDEFRARQFEWLSNVDAFKSALLAEHQICLQSVRGEGYRWVHPSDQTDVALKEFERQSRKVFRGAGQKLRNLRHLELTDDERRVNVDAIAKIAALAGMASRALR